MIDDTMTTAAIRDIRLDRQARTRSYIRDCVLLAVVTSEDVAASLIDQAVAASRQALACAAMD